MVEKSDLERIKEILEEFFEKLGIEVTIENLKIERETLFLDLKTKEPKLLIGEKGEVLSDLQHLIKAMIKKKIKENFHFDLDVNGYKKRKINYLRELAKTLADEVSLTKKEKILPPMPAYERRIIHLELASRPDVTTQSTGQEPNRRVIIKPYP